ncbi:hypothetical protein SI65_02662 [Aspergillus cristatus]|uniref:Uncharacterized protein n=1 Tax=Aspergillus cristatus TaxID=573508 RepID=A0A1E3BLN6_ASPCR|nr:hypothetical protein SI65_02662 [Aspergillus cristatus]
MTSPWASTSTDATTFAKKDHPEPHRIFGPNYRMLMDIAPDGLNAVLDEEGFVRYIDFY